MAQTITFVDGTEWVVPDEVLQRSTVIGYSEDPFWGGKFLVAHCAPVNYGLTNCCYASGTATSGYSACRECYEEISGVFDGNIEEADIIRVA